MRPRRFVTVDRLEDVARKALMGGYGTVATFRDTGLPRRQVHLFLAMDCQSPFEFEMHSRTPGVHGKEVKPLTIVVQSRCRKCEPCRKRRTMFWQARAVTEFQNAPLTLFGTLTISPENDARFDALSRISLAEQGVDFDRLPPVEMFRERVRTAGLELTKFLKRIREGDVRRGKPNIRYLLIAEAHNGAKTSAAKLGRPHWHILLHEQTKDARLVLPDEWERGPNGEPRFDKYKQPYPAETAFLKRQWTLGFSTFSLCRNAQAAGYLCKYLTKEDAHTRVRASFRYGTKWNEDPNGNEADVKRSDRKEKLDAPPKEGLLGVTGSMNGNEI